MKTYYGVVTTVYDNWKADMTYIGAQEFPSVPESTLKKTPRCDVWSDWFDTEEEALAFIKENKEA